MVAHRGERPREMSGIRRRGPYNAGVNRAREATVMDAALRRAVDAGDWGRCRAFLLQAHAERRASVGLDAASDLTALRLAALYEETAAQRMLERGLACDLHSACALGRVDDIARLASADSCGVLAEHLTPMGFALARGRLASVRALLDAGDNPRRALPRIGFFVWELAALAAGHGRWEPLHAASAHGYAPDAGTIAAALIEAGADVEAECTLGERPLHLAATYGWLPVLETLLAAGATVDAPTAEAPPELWAMAAPKDAAPAWGQTALMVAAREGAVEAVRLLLRHGARLDARDSAGNTPLHIAARPWWRENASLVALLLDAGAARNARDNLGRTPAELAAAAGFADSAALLG